MKTLIKPDYRTLFESAPVLYLVLLPDLTIVAVSDAFLEATFKKREEITGLYLFDIFPADPEDAFAKSVSNIYNSLKFVLEHRVSHAMSVQRYDIRRPDGIVEEKYWSALSKPLLNNNGEIDFIIHRIEDVTEFIKLKKEEKEQVRIIKGLQEKIKQAEQQREKEKKESEKDFSYSIINSLPGIFYLFDSNGKMMRWNKNFEKVSGYSTEEVAMMHPVQFFDTDEQEYIASRIYEVFTKGVSDAEANFFTKDKKKIPFYFTGTMILLDEGPCLIGMGIDVTEKVKAGEDLKHSYTEIRALATHLQNIREEERTSIAREIHDELGQQLTGLKMDILWLARKLGKQDDEIEKKIKSTVQLTDETVRTVRRIATELRPSILDDLGLIAAIEWHSTEFENRFSIQTVFKSELSQLDLEPATATGLFRIYQESLTNVLRHANAKKITSTLYIEEDVLVMNITDNGKGFDINTIHDKKTLGLLGMKERTLIMGGDYEIKSNAGKGTSVTVSVPLAK